MQTKFSRNHSLDTAHYIKNLFKFVHNSGDFLIKEIKKIYCLVILSQISGNLEIICIKYYKKIKKNFEKIIKILQKTRLSY